MAEESNRRTAGLSIVPLRNVLIQSPALTEVLVNHYEAYRPEECDFLRAKAIAFVKMGLARTYLIISADDAAVQGYFTLGIKCTRFEHLSEKDRRGFHLRKGVDAMACHLIGQISRAVTAPPGFGRMVLERAVSVAKQGAVLEGGKVMRIDCRPQMRGYYENAGFRYLDTCKETGLCLMIDCIEMP